MLASSAHLYMPHLFTHCLPTIICVMLMSIAFFFIFAICYFFLWLHFGLLVYIFLSDCFFYTISFWLFTFLIMILYYCVDFGHLYNGCYHVIWMTNWPFYLNCDICILIFVWTLIMICLNTLVKFNLPNQMRKPAIWIVINRLWMKYLCELKSSVVMKKLKRLSLSLFKRLLAKPKPVKTIQ